MNKAFIVLLAVFIANVHSETLCDNSPTAPDKKEICNPLSVPDKAGWKCCFITKIKKNNGGTVNECVGVENNLDAMKKKEKDILTGDSNLKEVKVICSGGYLAIASFLLLALLF